MPLRLSKSPVPAPAHTLPPVMTEEQVAAYLAYDLKKLRRLRYEGKAPRTIKIGNEHRIRREDLLSWMTEKAKG